jgi:hypothetical protein
MLVQVNKLGVPDETRCRRPDQRRPCLPNVETLPRAGLGFRAVSRVLNVLTELLGCNVGVCPLSVINWVIRLAIMRIGCYLAPGSAGNGLAPFSNGTMWLIDLSIGLG